MAYKIKDIYPNQTTTGDTGWPYGKPRNIQGGVQGTGTPFEEKLFQDYEGSRQALFDEAGIEPSGQADIVGQSDFVDALQGFQKPASSISNANGGTVQDYISNNRELLHLKQLGELSNLEENQRVYVKGYYVGSVIGGGYFLWEPLRNKSEHNGGTVIAPEALLEWDGSSAKLSNFLNFSVSGQGCFVRQGIARPNQFHFGAVSGGNQVISVRKLFESEKTISLQSNCYLPQEVVIDVDDLDVDASHCIFTNELNNTLSVRADNFKWSGGTFDAEDKNVVTMFRVESYCKSPTIGNLVFKNFSSDTYVRAFVFSEESVSDFQFYNITALNMYALPDGITTNLNGSVRGVFMEPYAAESLQIPSNGRIENIYGKDLYTHEEADLIQLISNSNTKDFNITIKNVWGINVGKRLVKIQARGVNVEDVYGDATNNTYPMWSGVSIYKENCHAKNIHMVGKSRYVGDSEGINNSLSILRGNLFGLLDSNADNLGELCAAFKIAGGSCKVSDIKVNGELWHIGLIFPENDNILSCKISDVEGTSLKESLLIKVIFGEPDRRIDKVTIRDFNAKVLGEYRSIWFTKSMSSGVLGTIEIQSCDLTTTNFWHIIDCTDVDNVKISDVTVNTVLGDKAIIQAISLTRVSNYELYNINTSTFPILLLSTNTSNGSAIGLKGASLIGARLEGGTDHIIGNVFCKGNSANPLSLGSGESEPLKVKSFNLINLGANP